MTTRPSRPPVPVKGASRKARERLDEARAELLVRLGGLTGSATFPRFEEALTHPSFANEVPGMADNQRLEFLGDSVLGLCVSEILALENPTADEGALTRMRAALVNAEALATWAREVGLGDAIALGKGAHSGTERQETNVLADAVEALVACVYDAVGLPGARALVREIVATRMARGEALDTRDPKSLLQEVVQAEGQPSPAYRVRETRGPEHEPTFVVEVVVRDQVLGEGEGRSKRLAERAAAFAALRNREPQEG
ncbi:MAG: ribonuclease III [Myxococcales bacterium]|nr:ribonuclease III [Myxococcales bacterium]